MTLRITGLLDFGRRAELKISRKHNVLKLDLFSSPCEVRETPTMDKVQKPINPE
jgi:hypothetical protein